MPIGWYVLYALAAVATLYTQYLGAALLIAVNLHALLLFGERTPHEWLRWLAANVVAAIAFLPWLPTFIDQQTHALNVSPRTPSGLVLQTLNAYGGGLAQGEVFVWAGVALVVLALLGVLAALVARLTTPGVTQGVTWSASSVTKSVTRSAESVTPSAESVTQHRESVTWNGERVTSGVTWSADGTAVAPSVTPIAESVTQGVTRNGQSVTRLSESVTPPGQSVTQASESVTRASESVTRSGTAVLEPSARGDNRHATAPRAAETWPLQAATLAFLVWVLPLGLVLYLGLRSGLFEVRYLVLSLPGLCLLAAAGLTALTKYRLLALLGTAALLVPAAQGLYAQYFDPALARDDYRGLVQSIESQAQPIDAIVLSAPNQVEVFDYYYHGSLPVIGLPAQRPIDQADTQARLAQLKQTYGRVWLVEWAINEADPPRVILSWLSQNGFQASHAWYGSVQLALIGFGSASAPMHQLNMPLSNGITLEAYQLSSETLKPGETLQLTLLWRAGDAPTADRWKVFTHILDANSKVVAQRDAEPGDTLRPTTTWQPGEEIKDNYGIAIPPDLAPGDYTLEIGMYNGDTRAEFAGQGNHLNLGTIHVAG
ncbi:MAG: hypothetical protein JOZ81_04365 [Chloroflexi bacterium]|nr:hypothetical protein [Chloroflexota bacterium]